MLIAKELDFENIVTHVSFSHWNRLKQLMASFSSAVFFSQHTWETTFHNEGNEAAMVFTSSFA